MPCYAIGDRSPIIDSTAFALCRDNDLPMRVFGIEPGGNIAKAIRGEAIGTVVSN
jgi:uridylate kinase